MNGLQSKMSIRAHLDKLSESQVQEETTTVGTRPRAHFGNFEIRHLTDNLNKCPRVVIQVSQL